ncbi:MAG TPA: alpha/beta hydrolase fold domain-containing protein [Acidobacteriaceae bacterium]|jgi:acetyl esterase/lipase|nr:alpha/beta hydrolase fold domain-containing protein [Acidobacteriaceae bacterium]
MKQILMVAMILCLPAHGVGQRPADAPAARAATSSSEAATRDTSYIDADGTAYITRVVPVPPSLSPEAKHFLERQLSDSPPSETLAERRHRNDVAQAEKSLVARRFYPVDIAESTVAGVPVRVVTPPGGSLAGRVLINLHGGSFNADSGSLSESIPIASLTGIKVVAVLYRLAPEHPFPAAVDDAVAVYRELLKSYAPNHIGIYGTSAGAILTGEVAVRLRQLGLAQPGVLGIFSGMGDFSREGDSHSLFSLSGLGGFLQPPVPGVPHDPYYTGTTDPRNPVLSPVFADLRGMPPTLFITSERDALLSGTTILHRAFLRAGNDNDELVVFEGLPHAFWYESELPESKEADGIMARFLARHLQ